MKSILNLDKDFAEVNTLFIQPTYLCSGQCKSCYVKKHIKSGPQMGVGLIEEIFRSFCFGENNCWANQITISIDCPDNSYSLMNNIFNKISDLLCLKRECEVHFTVRDYNTLSKYNNFEKVRELDLLSISNPTINTIDKIKSIGCKINWNFMAQEKISQSAALLESMGHVFDQIYLIFEKPSVGAEWIKKTNLQRDWETYDYLIRHYGDKYNLVLDQCYSSAVNFSKFEKGCSANVSRFQLWPDGSISGCPYANKSCSNSASNLSEIKRNLNISRYTYDFDNCCFR